ncbi:hypothetical protein Sango_1642900 [Sesamum angolense]|uniref:Uncharacterized protein n=1 Tax=Sesamum angolense TaxID=2727404 RepID=A0AAE1WK95_9LAMI|nr:hypothetical protein Sango_1642900 [Sesamum angolense]
MHKAASTVAWKNIRVSSAKRRWETRAPSGTPPLLVNGHSTPLSAIKNSKPPCKRHMPLLAPPFSFEIMVDFECKENVIEEEEAEPLQAIDSQGNPIEKEQEEEIRFLLEGIDFEELGGNEIEGDGRKDCEGQGVEFEGDGRQDCEGQGSKLLLRKVENSDPPVIDRMYFSLWALKKGFLEGCRPIIGLDGCFLKTVYGGQLLVVVGRDGNDNMFPIAMAVVQSNVAVHEEIPQGSQAPPPLSQEQPSAKQEEEDKATNNHLHQDLQPSQMLLFMKTSQGISSPLLEPRATKCKGCNTTTCTNAAASRLSRPRNASLLGMLIQHHLQYLQLGDTTKGQVFQKFWTK